MRVFLAHASANQQECDRIVAKLRARGFTVFYAADTIGASEDFDRRIRSEIGRCDAMVFLVSPRSVAQGCYALTELQMACERWPNPRGRILPVVVEHVRLELVPPYLRDNIHLLRPQGDLATETADAMLQIGRRRRLARRLTLGVALISALAAVAAPLWSSRRSEQARLNRLSADVVEAGQRAKIYTDTCVDKLDSFSRYVHDFVPRDKGCSPWKVLESLSPPALVVAQTGYGKWGFLQTVQATLSKAGKPSVLVTYRDCVRGQRPPPSSEEDLTRCVAEKVHEETEAPMDVVRTWLQDPRRYILLFDAIDDSASRDAVHALVRLLWLRARRGGPIVMSSQPENLNHVLARYGLEEWMIWIRDGLTTVDVRGVNLHSVQRIASDYEEHKVSPEDVTAVLDFPQRCPEAKPIVEEWVAQPKLFRDHGTHTVAPVVAAMRTINSGQCQLWRREVLAAMLRSRLWSYCHDELCDYRADSARLLQAARRLAGRQSVSDLDLRALARELGFDDPDRIAFPLLSTGVLYYDSSRKLRVDRRWIPD